MKIRLETAERERTRSGAFALEKKSPLGFKEIWSDVVLKCGRSLDTLEYYKKVVV